jgi:hypothetical protein
VVGREGGRKEVSRARAVGQRDKVSKEDKRTFMEDKNGHYEIYYISDVEKYFGCTLFVYCILYTVHCTFGILFTF